MISRGIPSVIVAIAVVAGTASAESIAGRYSFGLYGGQSTADLAELNDFFEFFNENAGIRANRLQEYDKFDNGPSANADIRYGFTENVLFGLSIGYSEFSVDVHQDWPAIDADNIIIIGLDRTVTVRTVPIVVSAYYSQPVIPNLRVTAGAGIGVWGTELLSESNHVFSQDDLQYQGELEFGQDPFESGNRSWTGREVGYQLSLGGEYFLTDHLVVAGEGIYRFIEVPEVTNPLEEPFEGYEVFDGADQDIPFGSYTYYMGDGQPRRTLSPTGKPIALDLSGATLSLGLRVYF